VSSVVTAATGGAVASSGGALGPSQIAPTYANPSAVATGGSGSGSGSAGNGTLVSTPTLSNPSASATTSVPASNSEGAAVTLSGSFIGAAGAALVAAIAAL